MEFTMKQIAQLTGKTYQKVGRTAKELELTITRGDKVSVDLSGLIKILRYYEEQETGEEIIVSEEETVSDESRIEEIEQQLFNAQEIIEQQNEHIANLTRANEMLRMIKRD